MIKAVIFDLDGTLADTLSSIAYFANSALAHYNYPPIPFERYKYLAGRGAENLVKGMLEVVGDNTPQAFENVYPLYNKTYDDNFMYLTTTYSGIPELIDTLKKHGIKLGVLSNKPHNTTVKIVTELFQDKIDLCYGKRDDIPRKPDPTALHNMLAEFNITKEECIYVGDTSTDMKTGKNAQVFTIGVTWGFRDKQELEEYHANLIVDQPSEIAKMILE